MKSVGCKSAIILLLFSAALCATNPVLSQTRQFQFEQFPAKMYRGPIHVPKWLHKEKDGEWTYSGWKAAAPPIVSFAGEYDLAAISCGTECRYYELTDLRTGVDVRSISLFCSTAARTCPLPAMANPI
jgi:hypothetical protein